MVYRYIKKIILKLSHLTGYHIPVELIRHIDVEPITSCNLQCSFCQVPRWERANKTVSMTLEVFKKIIDQFPCLKKVKIQGMGEPFINKQLPDFIGYCTNKGIGTRVVSNGTILNETIRERILDAKLNEIYFSFDGATKETYESLRVGASFEKVLENIRKLCELKKARNSNIHIGMVCLVSTQQVLKELPEYIQMAFDNGVTEVQIKRRLKNWKKVDGSNAYIIGSLMKVNEFHDYDIYFAQALEKARLLGVSLTRMHDADYSLFNFCHWPWDSAYISVEGKVVPCCDIGIPETWQMGDLMKEDIEKIWNNDLYRSLRRDMKKNNIRDICKACYGINH